MAQLKYWKAINDAITEEMERDDNVVLVGEDGGWGDLVAPTHAIAEAAVRKAGVTVHEDFDGEFAAKVRTGPYEWSRMAGIQVGGPANSNT